MNKIGVIVSGGTIDRDFAFERLEQLNPEIIIGVDRGLAFLHENQIMPTYIVGDFDSVDTNIVEYYKKNTNVPMREFNPVKDATDTEIALRLAIELGVKELYILGATGSRLDHVWGNVQTLKVAHDAGVKAYIWDSNNRISLLEKETILKKKDMYGTYFSLFPLGGSVEQFSIEGAKYLLNKHTLSPFNSLCVSNEIQEEKVKITFPFGEVILMETKD